MLKEVNVILVVAAIFVETAVGQSRPWEFSRGRQPTRWYGDRQMLFSEPRYCSSPGIQQDLQRYSDRTDRTCCYKGETRDSCCLRVEEGGSQYGICECSDSTRCGLSSSQPWRSGPVQFPAVRPQQFQTPGRRPASTRPQRLTPSQDFNPQRFPPRRDYSTPRRDYYDSRREYNPPRRDYYDPRYPPRRDYDDSRDPPRRDYYDPRDPPRRDYYDPRYPPRREYDDPRNPPRRDVDDPLPRLPPIRGGRPSSRPQDQVPVPLFPPIRWHPDSSPSSSSGSSAPSSRQSLCRAGPSSAISPNALDSLTVPNQCTLPGVANITVIDGTSVTCNAVYVMAEVDGVTKATFLTTEDCKERIDNFGDNLQMELMFGTERFSVSDFETVSGSNGNAFIDPSSSTARRLRRLGPCQRTACVYDRQTMSHQVDMRDCLLVSYGVSDTETLTSSGLRASPVRLVDRDCQNGNVPSGAVAMCFVSTNNQGVLCSGDGGAPVYCRAPQTFEWILMGVTSFSGQTCRDSPEVPVLLFRPPA